MRAYSRLDCGGLCIQNMRDDWIYTNAVAYLGKNKRPRPTHPAGITVHDFQIRAYRWSKIGLIDHEKVGLGDAWPAFAGDLVPTGHIDHINSEVGEFPAEMGG